MIHLLLFLLGEEKKRIPVLSYNINVLKMLSKCIIL